MKQNNKQSKDKRQNHWTAVSSLHHSGGQLGVLGVEAAGGLRGRLGPALAQRAQAGRLLQPLHHGSLADCCQADEDTLREQKYFFLKQWKYCKLTASRLGRSRTI